MIRAGGVSQFSERLRFDLSYSLAGNVELLAHFFQRVVGVHVDTEAHSEDLGFSGGEAAQDVLGGFSEAFIDG